jgi:hypothetical protein
MIKEWINGFERRAAHGVELQDAFVKQVARITRRYPNAYFALGQRTPEAIEDLADRSFVVCARVPKGRFPFLQRHAFLAYIEEQFDDRTIRYHTFDSRLSITREILRDDYARNIRRDPVLRWRDDLHRQVGRILPTVAERDGLAWTVQLRGPRIVRSPEDVIRRLRGDHIGDDLPDLVTRALSLLGQPCTHSRLTNLLSEVLEQPAAPAHEEEVTVQADDAQLTVRATVLTAWRELDEEARGLLAGLVRGQDYDTLIARFPGLRSRSGVSRAIRRIGDRFVDVIRDALGLEGDERPTITPKAMLEHVADVLLPLIDDLEDAP